jgi:protein O-mannosyl-transferase
MGKRSNKKKVAGSGGLKNVATTSVRVQGPPPWFRRDWLWGLILILFVILTYTPVWQTGFIWDDDAHLTANPCIVGPLGLKEIWTTSAADICPLTLTTFWVEHALWGLAPLPYHLVNVLLHGACALLLWRILRSLRVQGAWLGAALWALHPVAVESVAWITEMKNTESGLFFLLSILFFVRRLRAKELNNGPTGGGWNYALTLLFAALAMASKSSTVILPVVLCLCAWWMEGRWRWRNVVSVVPILLMSIAASALSIWTQGLALATGVTDSQWVRTWPERLTTAGDAVWFYLGKLLWPHPLITIYPRWQIDAGQWVSFLPLLAVIVILAIFWFKRELWSRACFFAFAYFMTALLPVLGLIDNPIFRFSLVFDHLQYLASIGPLALAGTGWPNWTRQLPSFRRPCD